MQININNTFPWVKDMFNTVKNRINLNQLELNEILMKYCHWNSIFYNLANRANLST